MRVTVQSVNIPGMSTIGYGVGVNDQGDTVHFAGDHRPMRDIQNALDNTYPVDPGDVFASTVFADIDDWQILAVIPKGSEPEDDYSDDSPYYGISDALD